MPRFRQIRMTFIDDRVLGSLSFFRQGRHSRSSKSSDYSRLNPDVLAAVRLRRMLMRTSTSRRYRRIGGFIMQSSRERAREMISLINVQFASRQIYRTILSDALADERELNTIAFALTDRLSISRDRGAERARKHGDMFSTRTQSWIKKNVINYSRNSRARNGDVEMRCVRNGNRAI